MKKLIFEFSPLMALLLILSLLMPVGFTATSTTPAMAAVDNCYITNPTTAAPIYVHAAGQARIYFSTHVDATAAGDVTIIVYTAGTSSIVGQTDVSSVALTSGDNNKDYYVTIWSGTAAGNCDVRVGIRQPAGSGDYTFSPLQTNAIIVDNTAPSTPTLLLPANASCGDDDTPTFTWSTVTKTGHTITYNFQANTTTSFTSPAVNVTGLGTPTYTPSSWADGTWYWRVQSVDSAGNTSSWTSARSICIDTAAPSLPVLTHVVNPLGTYNPTYTWTASTDSASCANIRYFVETFSGSCAGTLVDNVTGIANPQTGNPTITASNPLAGNVTYYWRVTAYDCAGNTSGPTACDSYSIPQSCTTATIHLGTGWNLFSLPLCPSSATSITPAALLALCDNTTAVQIIWGYDCSSGWQYYIPGSTSTLTSISVVKGYWVQTSSPVNIAITGTSCPAPPQSLITATLCPGWNLVGFKSCTSLASNVYFPTGIASAISFICGYSGGWNCFAPGATNLEPTKGYWVFYGGTTNGSYGLPCN